MSEAPPQPVPVTLLAGFLGSGKTTLLNHLLSGLPDHRVAILVNDFGDLNVDADLVIRQDADVLRMEGGCICCTMQAGVTSALSYLIGRDAPPSWVMIRPGAGPRVHRRRCASSPEPGCHTLRRPGWQNASAG
ncbi:MAG: GTP-binding protein, partial [Longimonas sp.]|uniref:GTP-binding protein n=1 Tax=Longimonas sp. TaxID=2039626 RepID=UPI003975CE57